MTKSKLHVGKSNWLDCVKWIRFGAYLVWYEVIALEMMRTDSRVMDLATNQIKCKSEGGAHLGK